MIKLNQKQREGLARFCDTHAAAASIALGTYVTGRLDLRYWEAILLATVVILGIIIGLLFRKD